MSRKGAKSRTRGRKLHLTGTKARVARTPQTRADLELQLKACRRKIAHARERLVEAMKQQTATSGVLRIISSSPAEIQPVLDAVAENAARLCDANNAVIFRLEDNLLRLVASYGKIPTTSRARKAVPANRDTVIGRAHAIVGRFMSMISPHRTASTRWAAGTQSARAIAPRLRRRCSARVLPLG